MEEENLKELEDLVDDALRKETEESLLLLELLLGGEKTVKEYLKHLAHMLLKKKPTKYSYSIISHRMTLILKN